MFGKLFKYEIKAVARTMLPIYLMTIALSPLTGISLNYVDQNDITFLATILLTAYGILVTLCFGVCLFITILRFRDNLFGREAYSTLTLPVSFNTHILVKLVSSILWMMLSGIVFITSLLLVIAITDTATLTTLLGNLPDYLSRFTSETVSLLFMAFTSFVAGLMKIYASMAIGYQFQEHPLVASIIAYVIFTIITTIISLTMFFHTIIFIIFIIEAVIFYLICYYILRFRLNLE